jgi:hypothetical protein
LLRDEPARRRIANNGAAAAQPFNWSTIARRHLELYSRLV